MDFLRASSSLIDFSYGPIARWAGLSTARIVAVAGEAPREPQQGVVFLRRADGDPHAVGAVGTDHNARVGGLLDEVQGVHAERQPDEVGLRLRQGVPGITQCGHDPGAFGDHGIGSGQ